VGAVEERRRPHIRHKNGDNVDVHQPILFEFRQRRNGAHFAQRCNRAAPVESGAIVVHLFEQIDASSHRRRLPRAALSGQEEEVVAEDRGNVLGQAGWSD
jgi:hypothetical protein